MKAQRRHELKENTLATRLVKLPSYTRMYGPRILLLVAVAALAFMLVRYQISASQERMRHAVGKLAEARMFRNNLEIDMENAGMSQAVYPMLVQERMNNYKNGVIAANEALEVSREKDVSIRSQALLCLGDLNWELANLPDVPGAATQPSLQLEKPRSQLLQDAETNYNRLIQQYPDQFFAVARARFGLAATYEDMAATAGADKGLWDKAKAQYQSIVGSTAPETLKIEAKRRLELLAQMQQMPVALVAAPTTRSAIIGPLTPTTLPVGVSTTLPTTQPERATTAPVEK